MRASAAGRPEEVLEVDPGASPKEVQTAWRDLSLALHPDKVRGALTADGRYVYSKDDEQPLQFIHRDIQTHRASDASSSPLGNHLGPRGLDAHDLTALAGRGEEPGVY